MKCTKRIEKTVFDEEKLRVGLGKAEVKSGDYVRMVMSHETLRSLHTEATRGLWMMPSPLHTQAGASYYRGCPIDINDGLAFGEVRFTTEIDV